MRPESNYHVSLSLRKFREFTNHRDGKKFTLLNSCQLFL
jgi:hypothetical protein